MRRIFITDTLYPADDATLAVATAAGATEIIHGVTAELAAQGITTLGYHEIPDLPPSDPVDPITAEVKLTAAKAVLDQLSALPAPVLTADVVDLLDDLRGVL